MKMRRQRIQNLLIIVISLVLLVTVFPYMRTNVAHIWVYHAYASNYSAGTSIDLLREALLITCKESPILSCEPEIWHSDETVLTMANRYFMNELGFMQIVTNSARIPIGQFTMSGLPTSLQKAKTSGVLYGPGYFQLRTFFVSDVKNCWQFAIKAKHDDPPPVNLEIWLDNILVGTLSYTKGDQSWDILSVYSTVKPGAHWMRIWFVNDYLDKETNTDRNAYVQYVSINRVGTIHCESN